MPKYETLPAVIQHGGMRIHEFRGARVVLDRDVAGAFGVETKHVNQARSRNRPKFTDEHAFQLT